MVMIKSCKQFCFPMKYNYVKITLSECKRRLYIELLCALKIIYVKSISLMYNHHNYNCDEDTS